MGGKAFLIGVLTAAAAASPAAAQTRWDYKIVTDPITDAKRGIASLTGDNGTIVVKCDEQGPDSVYVVVISRKFLGAGSRGALRSVTYRLDSEPPITDRWLYDRTEVAIANEDQVAAFTSKIAKASKLTMRATTFEGDNVDMQWSLVDVGPTMQRVYADCGAGAVPVIAAPGSRGELKNPVWEKVPTSDEIRLWYPIQAMTKRLPGRAKIKCEVLGSGALQNCVTVEETPEGLGFADAVKRLQSLGHFKLKSTDASGQPVGGTTVTFGLEFTYR